MTPITATTFPAEFDSSWLGFGGVHGGLAVASMLHAASTETTATPVAVTAHLTRPVEPGPVSVQVEVEHGGRTPSVRASIPESACALIRLTRDTGAASWPAGASDLCTVDPEHVSPLEIPVDFVPFSQYIDIRPINEARPFAGGADPEFEVWIRLLSSIEFSPEERAAVLLDALPPALFATLDTLVAIPTVEFSAYFPPVSTSRPPANDVHPRVEEEWHHLRHRTVWATDGLCVDESELRTSTGHLAGQARQLRRILTP
ncbi:thioesterase family protein [Rhodococcus marinonascens]|uniref:thioesterase family protein n=1 Tax=Rhodococcus marinonascens TaxID=38311 RepID=UPI00093315D5|nr:thioesterase family protein [Rhodococcus marinonascens]